MLTTRDLQQGIARMHDALAGLRDELNAADRQLGDVDTGMTIAALVSAWHAAAADLPADVGAALSALGRATRRASGSSLGGVLALGLTAAGKHASGKRTLGAADLAGALHAAAA